MRPRLLVLMLGALAALPLACKKDEQPPPQQPMYQQYPQQPQQQYPQQQYPAATAQPTAMPAPTVAQPMPQPTAMTPAPTPTGAATPGALSQPSPMALPCQSDAQCLTHRCNTQFGKCAWPCQSDNDCVAGNHCMAGACVPKMQ
jgi:hypothetical protein